MLSERPTGKKASLFSILRMSAAVDYEALRWRNNI